jgi:phospholipid/cholesterol/gamma-HCH transport system substrate-binding protein
MLTRFVRIQLVIFTIASVVGMAAMIFGYLQAPTLLGLGKITVKVELPAGGGLYRFSNVTYRGVQIGKVTSLDLTKTGALATLSLNTSPKIPTDLVAEVRSVSAVGEQYLDLRPRNGSPPYLHDGSVIAIGDTAIPQPVGPMLDRVSALIGSIPKDKLSALLDGSFTAFNGAGDDLGSLIDSSETLSHKANGVSEQSRALVDDSAPLLDGQVQSADDTRTWARSLAGVTEQIAQNDPQVRKLLQTGPGFAQEVSKLLDQVKPTLPILLANLTSLGKVAVTYRPALEQLLVLLPPVTSYYQSSMGANNATGLPMGDFRVAVDDPPACTVGYLPPSQWRSPADTTTIDTPDGLYCKLPQDSPIAVRGARNLPCLEHPGKRAPTVEICDSDKPYEPLAMRQHALGPYPLDPNLIAQGIPLDGRVSGEAGIFGPVEGTPLPPWMAPQAPPGSAPGVAPPEAGVPPAAGPTDVAPPPAAGDPSVAPSSFSGNGSIVPSLAIAEYDPRTGRYLTPDGRSFVQSDLVTGTPTSWKDLLMRPGA